ncbi:putative PACRG-like protein, partial [Apostichopus japonicus]
MSITLHYSSVQDFSISIRLVTKQNHSSWILCSNVSRSTAIGKSRGKEWLGKVFKDNWKPKSGFESVYVSGGLPCRLVHGSVKHKLQWDSDPEGLEFDPLLVTLAETSTKQSVYEGALSALAQLSSAVGPHLCPHLKSFLSYLSKGLMDKRYKEQIYSTLQHIEQTCGK